MVRLRKDSALRLLINGPEPTARELDEDQAYFMNRSFDVDVDQAARMFTVKPWHPAGTTSESLLEAHLNWIRDRYTRAIAYNARRAVK